MKTINKQVSLGGTLKVITNIYCEKIKKFYYLIFKSKMIFRDGYMSIDFLLTLGTNVLSSIVYDIGKTFVQNGKKSLTEKQLLEIINSFQSDIDSLYRNQDDIGYKLNCLQKQNENILKLLLTIFDSNNMLSISYTEDGYRLDGQYTLNSLNRMANVCLNNYVALLPQSTPKTLSEAVWPIPKKLKGVLLDEIEKNNYTENS